MEHPDAGTGIRKSFSVDDFCKEVQAVSDPEVCPDEIVALAMYSRRTGFFAIMLERIGSINVNCTTAAELVPLTEAEMEKEVLPAINGILQKES